MVADGLVRVSLRKSTVEMIRGYHPEAATLDDAIEEMLVEHPPTELLADLDRREKGRFVSRETARRRHGYSAVPRLVFAARAERELYSLPRSTFDAFQRAFDALERDPLDPGPPYRVKVLREAGGRRVIRFGVWGAIYRVEGDKVRILKVGPRSTLYQGR